MSPTHIPMQARVMSLLNEAVLKRKTVLIRSGSSFFEAVVDEVYDEAIIKFSCRNARGLTKGYMLLSEVDDVLSINRAATLDLI